MEAARCSTSFIQWILHRDQDWAESAADTTPSTPLPPPLPTTGLPSVVYSLSITIRMFWRRLDPGLTSLFINRWNVTLHVIPSLACRWCCTEKRVCVCLSAGRGGDSGWCYHLFIGLLEKDRTCSRTFQWMCLTEGCVQSVVHGHRCWTWAEDQRQVTLKKKKETYKLSLK